MTLRELWRMAWVRRREEWDRTCCIVAALSFTKVNPMQLNPIRRAEVERLRRKVYKNGDDRVFFTLLGKALGDKDAVARWQNQSQESASALASKGGS